MSAAFGHSHTQVNTHENKTPQGSSQAGGKDEHEGQKGAAEEQSHELIADRPPEEKAPASEQSPESSRTRRRPRGFAAMDRKLVSEIARKGGKAAHSAGTAHEFTTEEARVAGRKGGRATHAKRRARTETGAAGETGETAEASESGESGESRRAEPTHRAGGGDGE